MRNVQPFAITSAAALPVAWRRFPRVEKASLSNALDGERHDAPQRGDDAQARKLCTKPSHNETDSSQRNWNTARLVPGFVTQLIAQVTAEGAAHAASALSAYGHGRAPKVALLCDRAV
jgi:hypothetical protein